MHMRGVVLINDSKKTQIKNRSCLCFNPHAKWKGLIKNAKFK